MQARAVRVGPVTIGDGAPLAIIAGPCVIESRDAALRHAARLAEWARAGGLGLVYKSSFDKANRTSMDGFRGVGMDAGLRILEDVRRETGLPVLTDVHDLAQIAPVAAVVDVLQTPALLCRQTDFIVAVARAGKPVNLKKGQFLSPAEMIRVVEKARAAGNDALLVTERGFAFGYNNLVSDMRALPILAATGCPVVYDATHSVQRPGAQGTAPAPTPAAPPKASLLERSQPSVNDLPNDDYGKLARYGHELSTRTVAYIGPEVKDKKKRYTGNNLACTSCHQENATKPFAMPWVGVTATFPQYRGREDVVSTVEERVNGCMERSMNGKPLPLNSKEMRAFVTYIHFLSKGIPVGAQVERSGTKTIPAPNRRADLNAGDHLQSPLYGLPR